MVKWLLIVTLSHLMNKGMCGNIVVLVRSVSTVNPLILLVLHVEGLKM